MKTKLSHPVTVFELEQRDRLLQASLRQDFPGSSLIHEEYPLVLNHIETRWSYCFWGEQGELIGHLNCWSRKLSGETGLSVGVIGNVAVAPEFRRQGHMKAMFQALMARTDIQNLDGFILWTDEPAFYRSLGFSEVGEELLLTFQRDEEKAHDFFACEHPDDLTLKDLHDLHALRPQCAQIPCRTYDETRTLLKIPDCVLLTHRGLKGHLEAYLVVGRGCDFIATVHEWGGKDPDLLYQGLQQVLELTEWDRLCLMSPAHIEGLQSLFQKAKESQNVPMAFGRFKSERVRKIVETAFFWGLDSI